ncbi:MAG: glycerol-3-phosphate acyltransferase [Ruminococcus sp.]|nr:glycerol-3-phosphate acyltransferase [Ruminococcus sp.]
MNIAVYLILSYLIGNINPAYIISKVKGFDIRQKGTGNAGASNITLVLGKKAGIITALFDIFKAFAVTFAAIKIFPDISIAGIAAGSACILGHIFPVFMKFKGGKGLASLGGMILAYNPLIFLILITTELLIIVFFNYISLVAPTGSVLFAVTYAFTDGDIKGIILLSAIALIIILKHIPNFRRIADGTEKKISILWKKENK